MIYAAVFLALATMLGADTARLRSRNRVSVTQARGGAGAVGGDAPRHSDPLAAAFTLDVLAACLRSGMAVSAAAAAAAPSAPHDLGQVLRRASDLLALGADPVVAWTSAAVSLDQRAEALMRMARRSAASGSALAQGVSELACQFRDDAADAARASAERASVLIAGPLGVCYLPAFVCVGIVPVIVGLAGDVLSSGVL